MQLLPTGADTVALAHCNAGTKRLPPLQQITGIWQPKCFHPFGTGPVTGLKGSSTLSMICTMDAPQVLRSGCMMLAELPTPCTCSMQKGIHLSSSADNHTAPFAASQVPLSGLLLMPKL